MRTLSTDVRRLLTCILSLLLTSIYAEEEPLDTLVVKGGTTLTGYVVALDGEHYVLDTVYAGQLKILRSHVETVQTGDGRSIKENLSVAAAKPFKSQEVQKSLRAKPSRLVASTATGASKWKFEGGLNLTGKSGNTDRFDLAVNLKAELERQHDRFDFYSRYAYGTNRGMEAIDELIIGSRYTNFYFDGAGFFAREELEFDKFEGLGLRSTTAAGLSYQFRNEKALRIEARSGFSYRYESYLEADKEDFPGMDVGLDIQWEIWERLRFKGSYTFVPSVENLGDYIFEQDSGFSLPLDNKAFWSVRFGVATQFNSMPEGRREKLDLRYYTQLRASWK